MNLENQLKNLTQDDLIKLLLSLRYIHSENNEIITNYVDLADAAAIGSDELVETFRQQFKTLKRDIPNYDYRSDSIVSSRLSNILDDISDLVAEKYPLEALTLTEEFLALMQPAMNSIDDSYGAIGEAFMSAAKQWLNIAADVRKTNPDYMDWVKQVSQFYDNDNFGCLHEILRHSAILLTKEELLQLADSCINAAVEALAHPADQFNSAALHAHVKLKEVAKALNDMTLYEKGVLLNSPEPNEMQCKSLIEFAIEGGHLARAEFWLDQPTWNREGYRYRDIKTKLLKAQSNTEQLNDHYRKIFEKQPTCFTLKDYWAVATDTEKGEIHKSVIALSDQPGYDTGVVDMLLFIQQDTLAADYIVNHAGHLDGGMHSSVQSWALYMTDHKFTLAAILCYRALLNSLLERGYSKAYHHGADYFKALLKLDKTGPDYGNFADAVTYISHLRKQHSRKRSFWAQVE